MADAMQRRMRRPPFTHQLDHETQMLQYDRIVSELRERDATNFNVSRDGQWAIYANRDGIGSDIAMLAPIR